MIDVAMTLNAELSACRILRQWVGLAAQHGGATADSAKAVELAVGEALANAYVHAYKATAGPLHVGVVIQDRRMVVSVRDEGKRVAIPHIPAELSERVGGYGLFLIRRLAAEARVSHTGRNVCLYLRFAG